MQAPRAPKALALATTLLASVASAQLQLQPGELRENVAGAGRVIEAGDASSGPDIQRGIVAFSRADALTQNIRLYAEATTVTTKTAKARGALYVDFCVPRAGAAQCDAVSDPTAPDIAVNLTFKYGMVGEVISNLTSSASFGASAAVIDMERSDYVAYQDLGGLSVSGGNIKTIAQVPVPLPEFGAGEETLPVTFSTFVRRGKLYRFQLAASATATSTALSPAAGNFHYVVLQHPTQQGRVQLHNLTIRVGQEAPDLDEQVAALQESVASLSGQVGALGERVDLLGQQLDEQYAALSQAQDALTRVTAAPGSLLMREQGAPPPDGAVFVGSYRLVSDADARPRPRLTVDLYLVPVVAPAAARPAAPVRRR